MQIAVKQTSLPILSKVVSQARFPVNRIYCIGRNYREHAIEMGHNPDREPPFFFQKPADSIADISEMKVIPYPPMTSSLHFEAELVVAIGGEGGLRIPKDKALDQIFGFAIGCDLTRRDLQSQAKKMGRPWAAAKGFDYSAPCSAIVPKEETDLTRALFNSSSPPMSDAKITLHVNDEIRQDATLDKMIWNIPEMISTLSEYFRLKPGDLIMTGTPAGVGEIVTGDQVVAQCGDLPLCKFGVGHQED